ncbi:MAG: lipopolysaccharide heptosyltransferase II [Planctomycetales bacterium]|nr:lipopolysaccharide heptosyltransferase II [Planctomycetales bacterium]
MTPDSEPARPRTILVFCPNWVGDVVMATPTFECLKQNFPQARRIGLIRRYAQGVVEDAPWFDDLIEINDKTGTGFSNLVHRIRRLNPDLAIVLPNSFRTALIARLAGVRRIYGYRRNGRTLLLSGGPRPCRQNRRITPVPMAEYYLEICRWLGLDIPPERAPRLYISDSLQQKGDRLLERYGISGGDRVIGLNPGAKFGSSKCWPPQFFAKLADLLSERLNCKLLLFTGPGEESIGNRIVQLSQTGIINTGPDQVDLALLKPLVKRCQLLITNDTGPRHFAVAFGVPVAVIMGPTDPRYTHANLEKTIVLRHDLDCSPCHLKECSRDHDCMTEISPEAVLSASERLLQEHACR